MSHHSLPMHTKLKKSQMCHSDLLISCLMLLVLELESEGLLFAVCEGESLGENKKKPMKLQSNIKQY